MAIRGWVLIGLLLLLSGCLDQSSSQSGDAPTQEHEETPPLAYLNAIRSAAGMSGFSHGDRLSEAAQNHADYLAHHNMSGHIQQKGQALYSGTTPKDRLRFVESPSLYVLENVSVGQSDYAASIDGLMSAIYHRFGFLAFFADEIGYAQKDRAFVYKMGVGGLHGLCAYDSQQGGSRYLELCFDEEIPLYVSEYESLQAQVKGAQPAIVRYPYDGQIGVPTAFFQETPDPMPDQEISGYPVSVQFNPIDTTEPITLERFKLYKNCSTEPLSQTRILTEQSDPNRQFSNKEFALFPLQRLAFGTLYCVEFDYREGDTPHSLQWRFETESIANRIDIDDDGQTHTLQRNKRYHINFIPWDVTLSTAQNKYGYSATAGLEIDAALFDAYIVSLEVTGEAAGTIDLDLKGRTVHLVIE